MLASSSPFAGGEVVSLVNTADRIIHPNRVVVNGTRVEVQTSPNPQTTLKRTIVIETR